MQLECCMVNEFQLGYVYKRVRAETTELVRVTGIMLTEKFTEIYVWHLFPSFNDKRDGHFLLNSLYAQNGHWECLGKYEAAKILYGLPK